MDLLHNSIKLLQAVTFPFAHRFIDMTKGEDAELSREIELLVNHYLNYLTATTLWAIGGQDSRQVRTAPVLFHPEVQSMKMNKEEIKSYIAAYNSCEDPDVKHPLSLSSSWTLVLLHDLHKGVYILELSVYNKDRDLDIEEMLEEPSFITPRIIGEDMDESIYIFQHSPSIRCYEFTLIIPLLLLSVEDDTEGLNIFVEHSPNLIISHINLVKLRHRSGRWIDVTK